MKREHLPASFFVGRPNVDELVETSRVEPVQPRVADVTHGDDALLDQRERENAAHAFPGGVLAGELLKIAAGINVTHVPYPGAGPAIQGILAGAVPLMCASLPGAHPSILAGTLRALAVTGAQRWYDMPDVPTMLELGYAGFVSETFHCMLAPAGTPGDIVDRLATVCLNALKEPAFRDRLRTLGFEVIGNGPDGLRRRIADEVPRFRDLIAKAGIERV